MSRLARFEITVGSAALALAVVGFLLGVSALEVIALVVAGVSYGVVLTRSWLLPPPSV